MLTALARLSGATAFALGAWVPIPFLLLTQSVFEIRWPLGWALATSIVACVCRGLRGRW